MSRLLVIAGASVYGEAVFEAITTAGEFDVLGFLDDNPELEGQVLRGVPILGTLAEIDRLTVDHGVRQAVAAVGDPEKRRAIQDRLRGAGLEIPVIRHAAAVLSPTASVGAGSVFGPLSCVGPGAVVGEGVAVWPAVVIGHDTEIGNYCFFSPGAKVAGFARLGAACKIGQNAVVSAHVDVPPGTVVRAGTVY